VVRASLFVAETPAGRFWVGGPPLVESRARRFAVGPRSPRSASHHKKVGRVHAFGKSRRVLGPALDSGGVPREERGGGRPGPASQQPAERHPPSVSVRGSPDPREQRKTRRQSVVPRANVSFFVSQTFRVVSQTVLQKNTWARERRKERLDFLLSRRQRPPKSQESRRTGSRERHLRGGVP